MPDDAPRSAESFPDSRLRLGMETMLLTWIRTGLAMMGFGFVLARFGLFLQAMAEARHISSRQIHGALWFGVTLLVLGIAINVAATVMHYPYLVRARKGEPDLPGTWWLALGLGVISTVIGIALTALMIVTEMQT